MIRYALLCHKDHAFEAWFRDSDTFDVQNEAGQVGCPHCGTLEVRKALMAPAIRRTPKPAPGPTCDSGAAHTTQPAPSSPPVGAPIAAPNFAVVSDDVSAQMRASLRELHARLKATAEDVGAGFPDEARRIHDGEEPARAIYGTATDTEVRSLIEDGIGILPIPTLPDERN